jgi:hypothetical protein
MRRDFCFIIKERGTFPGKFDLDDLIWDFCALRHSDRRPDLPFVPLTIIEYQGPALVSFAFCVI